MKLKNKETGEIGELQITEKHCAVVVGNGTANCYVKIYSSLADLNEDWGDWEEYEEPKEYWYIADNGEIEKDTDDGGAYEERMKEIGNYFETEEEAEKAMKKLKAWKRLEDKGFRFTLTPGVGLLDVNPGKFQIEINADMPAKWFCCDAVQEDLDACFGGEE